MMCGLPGSGKTTMAKKLAVEKHLLRFCPDEWIAHLFGVRDHIDNPATAEERRNRVEQLQLDMALQALSLGNDVILENGFWPKVERDMYRERAKAVGATVKIIFMDVSRDELWRRIEKRNKEPGAFVTTEQDIDQWIAVFEPPTADELD